MLVANLVDLPHRFTRDIDIMRRRGRPSPDDLREVFHGITAIVEDDNVAFPVDGAYAIVADHDEDGYDGIKVFIRAFVGSYEVDLRVDVGFGDAAVPPASRRSLDPFSEGDEPASVLAYEQESVIAEKVETLVSKFPAVLHPLKDILDVVTLAEAHSFTGAGLAASLRATFDRRRTPPDQEVLDDMHEVEGDRGWQSAPGWRTPTIATSNSTSTPTTFDENMSSAPQKDIDRAHHS